MKKLLFTIFFAGIFMYSNAETSDYDNLSSIENHGLFADFPGIFHKNPAISEIDFMDCTIRAKVRITFDDGTSLEFEGEITFVGVSCGELLKQLTKK